MKVDGRPRYGIWMLWATSARRMVGSMVPLWQWPIGAVLDIPDSLRCVPPFAMQRTRGDAGHGDAVPDQMRLVAIPCACREIGPHRGRLGVGSHHRADEADGPRVGFRREAHRVMDVAAQMSLRQSEPGGNALAGHTA